MSSLDFSVASIQSFWVSRTRASTLGWAERGPFAVTARAMRCSCWTSSATSTDLTVYSLVPNPSPINFLAASIWTSQRIPSPMLAAVRAASNTRAVASACSARRRSARLRKPAPASLSPHPKAVPMTANKPDTTAALMSQRYEPVPDHDPACPKISVGSGSSLARSRLVCPLFPVTAAVSDYLLRRHGQIVQGRPMRAVRWADITESSTRVRRRLAAWQQYWQHLQRRGSVSAAHERLDGPGDQLDRNRGDEQPRDACQQLHTAGPQDPHDHFAVPQEEPEHD